MRYYHLSDLQKMDISITTFLFFVLIGFLRPFFLNREINTRDIIAFSLLFFVWYGCTLLFSNAFTYENIYNKITNI